MLEGAAQVALAEVCRCGRRGAAKAALQLTAAPVQPLCALPSVIPFPLLSPCALRGSGLGWEEKRRRKKEEKTSPPPAMICMHLLKNRLKL